MFVDVGIDLFAQLKDKNIESTLIELVIYFNTSLQKIGKKFKCVYPGIAIPEYQFVNNIKK